MGETSPVTQDQIKQLEKRLNGFRDAEQVSLKEHFDTRFNSVIQKLEDMEKEIDRRFNASELATRTALAAADKRFDNTNEWRASFEDVINNQVNKNECQLRHEADTSALRQQGEEIRSLQLTRAEMAGKATKGDVVRVTLFTAASLAIAIVGVILALVH